MHPGTTLTDAMRQWPSPDANAFNAGQSAEARARRKEKELAKGYNGNGGGEPLAFVAEQWSTPRAMSGGPESAERKKQLGRTESGGGDLQAQTREWGTPRAAEWKGTGPQGSKSHHHRLKRHYLDAQAENFPTGLPHQMEIGLTSPSDSGPRRLNCAFAEWLMGWPLGWTDFAALGTEWSHWQQRTRSVFLRLNF
jgi:hypothetical protein